MHLLLYSKIKSAAELYSNAFLATSPRHDRLFAALHVFCRDVFSAIIYPYFVIGR